MAISISGILKTPQGSAIQNAEIIFEQTRTSTEVLAGTKFSVITNQTGNYSSSLGVGTYVFKVRFQDETQYRTVASNVIVTQSMNNYSLNQIIQDQSQLQDVDYNLLQDVIQARDQAAASKQAAQSSQATASTKASEASSSAQAALASKNAAQTSEANALASKNAAQTSQTNADSSQTAAANSQTAAANSQTTSTTKATEASNSAQAALASKNAAQTSETNALASKNAAQASQTTASTKASEASTSQAAASTKAGEAATSQTQAQQSQSDAADSASQANTSKQQAQQSQASASTSQATATTKASEASSSAQAALTSKNAAQTSETNALASKNAAQTSQTNAANSQTGAATSQTTATTKASEASASQTQAQQSQSDAGAAASQADDSEQQAQQSQTAAAGSQSTATTKASEASSSAQAALASKNAAQTSETNALASKNQAQTSQTNAANSQTAAAGSQTTASTKASQAATSQTQAQQSQGDAGATASQADSSAQQAQQSQASASTSQTTATTKTSEASSSAQAALASKNAAQTSETNALSSKNAAQTSQTNASGSQTAASTSQTTASTKAGEASTSQTNAAASQTTASTKAGEASTSQTNAAASQTTATTKAGEASSSQTAAASSQSTATTKAAEATNSATLAQKWAANPENSVVSGGLYSALHYAAKAAQSAQTASGQLVWRGGWSAQAGTAPPNPSGLTQDFYRITQAGSILSVQYEIGDYIHWDSINSIWFKMDGTDSVISVNGRTGAVVVTKTDVGLSAVNNWGASSQTNDASTTTYATTAGVKAAYDLAATKLTATANAVSATKLVTARMINGTNFDGSGNITTENWGTARTLTIGDAAKSVNGAGNVSWSLAEIGAAPASHTHNTIVSVDNRALKPSGSVACALNMYFTSKGGLTGTADTVYGDLLVLNGYGDTTGGVQNALFFGKTAQEIIHYQGAIGATQWSSAQTIAYTSSNVASATKLQTARTIGGVAFDGTANINLPGVNTAGTQNTTGNAATATKLATARTIAGVSFDGTANISLTAANVGAIATTGGTATGNITAPDFIQSSAQSTNAASCTRKDYVDSAIAAGDARQVSKSGDTMTGTLNAPDFIQTTAQSTNVAASTRKDYVDAQIAAVDAKNVAKAGDKMTGNLTVPKVLLSAAQGSEVNALTRKDYVDGLAASKLGSTTNTVWNATGAGAGQGLAYNSKTAIGGVNDSWLRINPNAEFTSGIYCGTALLRTDGSFSIDDYSPTRRSIRLAQGVGANWSVDKIAFIDLGGAPTTGSTATHLLRYKDTAGATIFTLETLDQGGQTYLRAGAGNYLFNTDGEFNASGNGNFNDVYIRSDKRLKSNLIKLGSALDKVGQLQAYSYDKHKSLTDRTVIAREVGLVAQDVKLVIPEAVKVVSHQISGTTTEEVLTISNSAINAVLVEALKELAEKVAALETRLKEVENVGTK